MRGRLQDVWANLDEDALLRLVIELGWADWRATGGRIEGPCPFCGVDRDSGYVYVRRDGPPWLNCHRAKKCGVRASLVSLLVERLGRPRAMKLLLEASGAAAGTEPWRLPKQSNPLQSSRDAEAGWRMPTSRDASGDRSAPRALSISPTYRTNTINMGSRRPGGPPEGGVCE